MTVVRLLELDGWQVAVDLEQPVPVEPVDPVQCCCFDVFDGAPGPRRRMSSVLNRPITDSANALSSASPTVPTEASIPASARRSVNAIDVY